MGASETVRRVRIYLSQSDQWEGGPRYLALIEQLRRAGATGATALQGLAGFGPGPRSRPGPLARADGHQPVVVEWLDRAERVERLLPLLDALIGEALVTVEAIPVYRATMRASGPFVAERGVGELMSRPAPTVFADTPLAEALALMAAERLGALPVAEREGRLAGLLTRQDLVWRAGVRLPLAVLPLLTPDERASFVAPHVARTVGEVMSVEPRSLGVGASVPQALVTMIEWDYPQLPVVDREGRVVGIFSQEHVLREAVAQAAAPASAMRDAEQPTLVRLVMQTGAQQIPASARLAQALAQLVAAPERSLLVVDGAGRLVGAIDSATALRGLDADERAAVLAALQRPATASPAELPGADSGLERIVAADPPTASPELSALDAARRLLELDLERLAVVDDEGRLLGIIGRGGLIRALMQQSE